MKPKDSLFTRWMQIQHLAAVCLALLLLPARLPAATHFVTTANDAGPGSLRQAIHDANATPDPDIIAFSIPGGGQKIIAPKPAFSSTTFNSVWSSVASRAAGSFSRCSLLQPGVAAGGRFDLGAVKGLQGQPRRAGAQGHLHGLFEDGTQGLFVHPPETPPAVVVGGNEVRPPQQGQLFGAGGFQFAGRAEALEVAVEPDEEEQAGVKGRAAFGGDRHGKAQGGQVELVDELAQEAGRVIGGDPVFQGGRKEKLLAVVGWIGGVEQQRRFGATVPGRLIPGKFL